MKIKKLKVVFENKFMLIKNSSDVQKNNNLCFGFVKH